jgi:hypothetical protein
VIISCGVSSSSGIIRPLKWAVLFMGSRQSAFGSG